MPRDRVIVVGAGIQGAGVAQAAAAAGYAVTVIERRSVGGATSSNSSKLIHGGLRYLETAQLALVRECLLERRLLLKLAPDLISLQRFHIPIYQHSKRKRWQIQAGLGLYGLLSGGGQGAQFGQVERGQWHNFDGLQQQQLLSLHYYYDAQTDDQQLTQAVMASAQSLGAELVSGEVKEININAEGCEVSFIGAGREQQLQGAAVVNCCGPWANQLLEQVSPAQPPLQVELIQGSHLLLSNTGIQHYFYLESPHDQRAIFALPYRDPSIDGQQLLLGTTEIPYSGNPANIHCLEQEQQYLLDTLYFYFPQLSGHPSISKHFCGLRVLPKDTNQSSFRRHRDTLYHLDNPRQPRLVTVAGGKLTSYRLSAQKVIAQLQASLRPATAVASTDTLPLTPP